MSHRDFCYLVFEDNASNEAIIGGEIEAHPLIEQENRINTNIFVRSEGDITAQDETDTTYLVTPNDNTPYKFVKWQHIDDNNELSMNTIEQLTNYYNCDFADRDTIKQTYWINNY